MCWHHSLGDAGVNKFCTFIDSVAPLVFIVLLSSSEAPSSLRWLLYPATLSIGGLKVRTVFTPMMSSRQFRDTETESEPQTTAPNTWIFPPQVPVSQTLSGWKRHRQHERPEAGQDSHELSICFKDFSFAREMLHKGSCSQEWAGISNRIYGS